MRTNTIEWLHNDFPRRTAMAGSARTLNRALCLAAKAFTALVPALAIVVGAAWAITVPRHPCGLPGSYSWRWRLTLKNRPLLYRLPRELHFRSWHY